VSDDRSGAPRRSKPLFDRIVVVDWSASSVPKRGRDSIWIASATTGRSRAVVVANPATRSEAIGSIRDLATDPAHRTLVGVDFSLGFPRGTAAALGVTSWSGIWRILGDEVVDDERNRNNRFVVAADLNVRVGDGPGPFWGRPSGCATPNLTIRKHRTDRLPEWRRVEERLRNDGWRPFSVWQLLGAGSVGGQSLVGIAALDRLRRTVGGCQIWPFATGLVVPMIEPGSFVVAEVWPRLFATSNTAGSVRDEQQVRATAAALADLDRAGSLGRLFTPPVSLDDRAAIVDEEGWMLWPR
jgi:precorrin-8X/cobalt-precorrin-8 methylmutase